MLTFGSFTNQSKAFSISSAVVSSSTIRKLYYPERSFYPIPVRRKPVTVSLSPITDTNVYVVFFGCIIRIINLC